MTDMRGKSVSLNGSDEAARYYRNARELLARCEVEEGFYKDLKPVREAFGSAWLAVDLAIKAALRARGLPVKQVPRSWEPLRAAVVKHLAVRNGKLITLLNHTYEMVHLEGYYYGAYRTPLLAKGAFDVARRLISTLSSRRIA